VSAAVTGTLVVRTPNWLGDAVMAIPALSAVRRHHAGQLVIAAPASLAPLFDEDTGAGPDRVLVVNAETETAQLRTLGAEAILLLPNSFHSAWIARRGGIRERWGYRASGRQLLLTRSVSRPRGHVHQVRYYAELVRGLGIEVADETPHIQPRPATLDRADALLSGAGVPPGARLVAFAPGAAYGHAKRWPPARVAAVIADVAARGLTPVVVGAAGDRDTARAIESSLPAAVRFVDLTGRTTLRELVGVLARCTAFVSNDSGAMHVAAALGVPLTAIFGPTDERETAPVGPGPRDVILRDVFCRPCMLRECPIDHRCMKRIDAAAVLDSVEKHVALGATGRVPRS
jgi:heptosyltransferase-2